MDKNKIKWRTESIYVDHQTGEIITKKHIERKEYIKIKTTHETKYEEYKGTKWGIRKFTTVCERNRQQRLFDNV